MTEPAVVAAPTEAPTTEAAPVNLRQDAANIPSLDFKVPDTFSDRKWASNIKSQEDLFNQFDNLQSMVGKKSIPTSDATPEQLDEFYTQLRPETHEAYELTLPEGVEAEINADDQLAAKEFFHKNGFTQKQAQALFEFDLQRKVASMPNEAALDAQFDELMKSSFGDKANDALKIAHTHLATESKEVKEAFSKAPPELMAAVVGILNNNHNKFAGEDVSPETGATGAGETAQDKLEALTKLRLDAKKMTPGRERDEAQAKINKLEKEFASLNRG